jgi:hypothetical protein
MKRANAPVPNATVDGADLDGGNDARLLLKRLVDDTAAHAAADLAEDLKFAAKDVLGVRRPLERRPAALAGDAE